MLIRKIPDFTLESTAFNGKMFTADEQRAGFLDTLQKSFDCARTSSQRTQERQEGDFDRRFCKSCERTTTGVNVLIHVLDSFTKTPKLGFPVDDCY